MFITYICRSTHESSFIVSAQYMGGSRGGGGGGGGGGGARGPDPMKNHKNIGFLSNTGLDPLQNHKATKPAFDVGPSFARQRNAI